ncbi:MULTISPECIES: hypothetical protein [Neptunomonas]|uniref:Uncharacterized protein n=1 Tax=Neptunomonas qingdaonensis TaxID=1045558 RepID=A0A1I2NVC1_9GAMM|nr:hypothetical protein [Neptunomonas qingdaonensis]SFG05406.1 hypothetical protein SAMN05216175_10334 [Neptunomonas qingdaonensis]
MGSQSLSKLLQSWEEHVAKVSEQTEVTLSINQADVVRLAALAEIYKLPEKQIIATLIHEALNELEAKMPYVPGKKVIRVEDGDEIFQDTGPMPEYLAAQKRLLEQ